MVTSNKELLEKMQRRVYEFGPPNSFKTTAILKTAVYPLILFSPPGEKGWATIPDGIPGLTSFVWRREARDVQSSESIRAEFEGKVLKAIAGDYGPVRTIAIDGFHKLYEVYLNIASGGAYQRGEDFEPRLYSRAHKMAERFIDMVVESDVEYATFTSWNAKEPDKVGGDARAAHEWPDLPGKAAKLTAGQFSVVVFNQVKQKRGPDGLMEAEWLLRPNLEVWGASVKMDPRLVAKLPATCPQDFKQLYKIIGAAQQEVEKESENSSAVA